MDIVEAAVEKSINRDGLTIRVATIGCYPEILTVEENQKGAEDHEV